MTSDFAIAVHALVYLNHKATVVKSRALAENICANAARVRKVMAKLKAAGLVEATEGADGGYTFPFKAKEVNLKEVAVALNTEFVGSNWKSGDDEMECFIASGMAGVMDDVYSDLNLICYDRLEKITLDEIDGRIFKRRRRNGSNK